MFSPWGTEQWFEADRDAVENVAVGCDMEAAVKN